MWSQLEKSYGHKQGKEDLLCEFEYRLECEIEKLKADEKQGLLTPEEREKFASHSRKLVALLKPKSRSQIGQKLLNVCGVSVCKVNRQTALTKRAETNRLLKAWSFWDRNLWLAGCADVSDPELADRIGNPAQFVVNRQETGITMSDQIPVWLRADEGKILVDTEEAAKHQKQRRLRKKARASGEELPPAPNSEVKGPGTPANSRHRVSFVARQAVDDYFKSGVEPRGRILDSILVVYGVHARLDNISLEEPAVWLENETFEAGGVKTVRKAGERVGPKIMKPWRELRANHPELFQGIKVWQQPAANVDSVIFQWQAKEEAAQFKQQVRLVDMFAGAWSETSAETNFLLQTLQSAVGPGMTAITQVTDVGFASEAKAAGRKEQDYIRYLLRLKARQEGVAPSYKCGAVV